MKSIFVAIFFPVILFSQDSLMQNTLNKIIKNEKITKNATLIKSHEYGMGDCWGNINKFTFNVFILIIDSSSCGMWGSNKTFYLLDEKDNLKFVYQYIVDSEIDPKLSKMVSTVKENLYDFRNNKNILKSRSYPMNDLIKKGLFETSISDYTKKQFEKVIEDSWKSELDTD